VANNFSLTLDTVAPAVPSISLAGGAAYTSSQTVTATISTADTPTTGYTMKIWGDLDLTQAKADGLVGGTATGTAESDALFISFVTSKSIKLSAGDGSKTIYCKIRDDVYNISAQASDAITLDTSVPTISITGPDVSKVSKQTGKDTCSFSFTSDTPFEEYKVKAVPATGSLQDAGTSIPTTAGSTNMAGSAGGYAASTPINCTIKGTDLETASAGDGAKIIKVFVRDAANNWSV
jgi:hypothetical protein